MTIDTQISERERDILRLVATGATNQQIAHQLNISVNTVKVHLRNIFGKIGVASRTEATVYAIRQGLISVADAAAIAPEAVDALPTPAIEEESDTLAEEQGHEAEDTRHIVANHIQPVLVSTPFVPPSTSEPVAAVPQPVANERAPAASRGRWMLVGLAGVCVVLAAALIYVLLRPTATSELTPTPAAPSNGVAVNHWKAHAPLAQARSDFGVVAYDGKLYLIGGADANGPSAALERYDPTADQTAALTSKPTPASHIQATVFNGRMFVPGGEGKNGDILTVFEMYDPRGMTWDTLTPLPSPRSRYALANLDGRLYLFGGWDGKACTANVFIYDPERKQWGEGDAMSTPRCDAGAVVIEGQIYLVGGANGNDPLRTTERYDPTRAAGRQWETGLLPLPIGVATPAPVEFARTILVFDPQSHTAVQYYPRTDTWTSVALAQDTALSNRAVALGPNMFTFGQPAADRTAAVSEYQAAYNTFLPNISTSDK